MSRYAAVVGPGEGASPVQEALAREAGRRLAEAGAVVVTGGLGGVMAAAAEGVAEAGGTSLALLPGRERAAAVGPHTVVVPTGLGEARNALVVRTADVVLCVGWSWGTLSEVALAVRTGVPVVALADLGLPPPVAVQPDVSAAVAEALSAAGPAAQRGEDT